MRLTSTIGLQLAECILGRYVLTGRWRRAAAGKDDRRRECIRRNSV